VLRRAIATSFVVGILLTLANHANELFGGSRRPWSIVPMAVT
jgi:hypothetical protein